MLQNPSRPSLDGPTVASAYAAEKNSSTSDEKHALNKLTERIELISRIAERAQRGELEIKDARRLCVALSFLAAIELELAHALKITRPTTIQYLIFPIDDAEE